MVKGGTSDEDNLIVLCPTCHDNVHLEHITADQLRLYKRGWVAVCRLRDIGLLCEVGDRELSEILERIRDNSRLDRMVHILGEFSGGRRPAVVDPVPQLVTTLIDIMENSAGQMSTTASVKKSLAKEFFTFYQLLHRMRNNTLHIKQLLDTDKHLDGEPTNLHKTDMPKLIHDQAATVFSMYRLLVEKWEFFELYIPDFSYHLWALFNCREGILCPIAHGCHHPDMDSAITVFTRLDSEMITRDFVRWIPFFDLAAHKDHYHPTVNHLYDVHGYEFLTFNVAMKNSENFRFLSKELERIISQLTDAIKRFGEFLREHFDMPDILEVNKNCELRNPRPWG